MMVLEANHDTCRRSSDRGRQGNLRITRRPMLGVMLAVAWLLLRRSRRSNMPEINCDGARFSSPVTDESVSYDGAPFLTSPGVIA